MRYRFNRVALEELISAAQFYESCQRALGSRFLDQIYKGINSILDLKGKSVGVGPNLGSDPHLFVSAMATYVGLDPVHDINWTLSDIVPIQLFADRKIDGGKGTGRCHRRRNDRASGELSLYGKPGAKAKDGRLQDHTGT